MIFSVWRPNWRRVVASRFGMRIALRPLCLKTFVFAQCGSVYVSLALATLFARNQGLRPLANCTDPYAIRQSVWPFHFQL